MTGGILLERLPRGLNESPLMPDPCCACHCHAGNLHPLTHTCGFPASQAAESHLITPPLKIHPAVSAPSSVLGDENHTPSRAVWPSEWPIDWDPSTEPNTKDQIFLVWHLIFHPTPDKGWRASFPPIAM